MAKISGVLQLKHLKTTMNYLRSEFVARKAKALEKTVKINGVEFDGSKDIEIGDSKSIVKEFEDVFSVAEGENRTDFQLTHIPVGKIKLFIDGLRYFNGNNGADVFYTYDADTNTVKWTNTEESTEGFQLSDMNVVFEYSYSKDEKIDKSEETSGGTESGGTSSSGGTGEGGTGTGEGTSSGSSEGTGSSEESGTGGKETSGEGGTGESTPPDSSSGEDSKSGEESSGTGESEKPGEGSDTPTGGETSGTEDKPSEGDSSSSSSEGGDGMKESSGSDKEGSEETSPSEDKPSDDKNGDSTSSEPPSPTEGSGSSEENKDSKEEGKG